MTGIVVGKAVEIPVGGRKIIVPFRGRAGIGIFNVNGSFYALRNICPHKRGPLCTGEVAGRSTTTAPPSTTDGFVDYERDGEIIRCPGTPGNSISPAANVWSIPISASKLIPSSSTATISSSMLMLATS